MRRTALALTAAGALTLTGGQAALAAPGHRPAARIKAAPTTSGRTVAVTLVTGDRVLVHDPGGAHPTVSVTPAQIPGRSVFFSTTTANGGHVTVVPSDMIPMVGSVLDPALFDVGELIREGYDDAHAAALPLIVQRGSGVRNAAGAFPNASVRTVRRLDGIYATAVREPRDQAASGLGRFLSEAGRAAMGRHGAVTSLGTTGPLAGVTHIWLDAKVKAAPIAAKSAAKSAAKAAADPALDWNLNKIGAPDAWAAGGTGKGVKVAVIDSGVDTTHPDLAGKVIGSANFSDAPDAVDHFGSGTFNAGAIAGTGAAADGHRKGVAFEADLLNAKVIDDNGMGTLSSVLAGMEWAAQNGAKVADLSVADGVISDGKDPLSLAVDRLTEQYGTLFVAPAVRSIEGAWVVAPGAATDALTVGETNVADQVPMESARGPRWGDYSLKPDLTAPAVNVVQPLAAGTGAGQPVDQYYTMASGPAVAPGPVAGSAALLAAAHPDWTPARLKAVLQEGTDTLGVNAYTTGAGRLNVAHALRQQVVPDHGAVDFGFLDCTARTPASRQVTLTNTGDGDVTYDLSLKLSDQNGYPDLAGAATLSGSRITVPAGGSADVKVTVDPSLIDNGAYTGNLLATPVGTGTPLHLPVALWRGSEMCPLHISALDRDGAPTSAVVRIMNRANGFSNDEYIGADGRTLWFQQGRHFSMIASLASTNAAGKADGVLLSLPDVFPYGMKDLVLDGRKAHKFSVAIPGRRVAPDISQLGVYQRADQQTGDFIPFIQGALVALSNGGPDLYAGNGSDTPAPAGSTRTMQYMRLNDATAADQPWTATTNYDLDWAGNAFPADLTHMLSAADIGRLARVDTDIRQPGAFGDRLWEARVPALTGVMITQRLTAPGHRTDYVTPGIDWLHHFGLDGSYGRARVDWENGQERYAAGRRSEVQLGGPLGSTADVSVFTWPGTGAHTLEMNIERMTTTTGAALVDSSVNVNDADRRRVTYQLWRNGQLILDDEREGPVGWSVPDVPAEKTDWELHGETIMPGILAGAGTEARTTWDFSTDLTSSGSARYTAPVLELGYLADLDEYDKARPGRPMNIGITAQRHAGAVPGKVISMKAAWSTDGGDHWNDAVVVRTAEGRYLLHLPAAALVKGGTVALRVTAKDDGGSSVDQILNKAFAVEG